MMPQADRLLDEAIDLIIRLRNGPGNAVTTEMIGRWRARSPEHERTWIRVAEAHGMSGQVLTVKRRAERRNKLGLTRRNLMLGGAIGIVAAGAGAYVVPEIILRARADHITAKGEIRRIELADGSIALLGPDSALAFDYAERRRTIALLQGMAFFEVAADETRPFRVHCGALSATAIGTAFDMSSDAGRLSLSVQHGVVAAQASGSALVPGERLMAGDWVMFDPGSESLERGKRPLDQIATWRDNLIAAEGETVAALVARIARWCPGTVVIADPSIGRRKVSGIFDLKDPKLALAAVVHPAGGTVRQISPVLTVISPF
jgi:transmembrane sensor